MKNITLSSIISTITQLQRPKMAKTLVIVESPAKAKTIKGYLGKGFQVLASVGHVRDLIPKEGAVDTENQFAMKYEAIKKNQDNIDIIAKAVKKVDTLLLATDQDREGEAISWHLKALLEEKGLLKDKTVNRIVFNQITRRAILEAVENPRDLAQNLIDAQQARRALDYLVGFKLSPLLWRKIRRGLSAGRVQSPALRMICEREIEIEKFQSKEYWSIHGHFKSDHQNIQSKLTHFEGKKLEQFSVTNTDQAEQVVQTLSKQPADSWIVSAIKERSKKKNPPPPFITASLQQEAVKKLGFSASRTMRIAQQLYEGIDVDGAQLGLITYMRTDSVQIADEALAQIRAFIEKKYGSKSVNPAIRIFKSKAKNAQEAHEAIRPTHINKTPESLKDALSNDQIKLYRMIWQRTMASQMQVATIDQVSVDISSENVAIFRTTGSSIRDPGYLLAYREGLEENENDETKENYLPKLTVNQPLACEKIDPKQHFTEPPPRYSEASLIKALEEYGIGRPSTYASIISTLQQREYVELTSKRFHPTDVGQVVNKFLTAYFTRYVDYDFTAGLEDKLDALSRGEQALVPLLDDFWQPFSKLLIDINDNVQRKDITEEKLDETCPKCKAHHLVSKLGRNGRFIGCSNYPECDYTRSLEETAETAEEAQEKPGRDCPTCGKELIYKQGRYGKFIGCSGYPECKYIESLNKAEDTGVTCPLCNKNTLSKRKARRGNFFYSCQGYPKCKYIVSHPPLARPCSACGYPITMHKTTKRNGEEIVCPECKHSEPYEKE